jgi:hypothetical protein
MSNPMDISSLVNALSGGGRQQPTFDQERQLVKLRVALVERAFGDGNDSDSKMCVFLAYNFASWFDNVVGGDTIGRDEGVSPIVYDLMPGITDQIREGFDKLVNIAVLRRPDTSDLWEQGVERIMNAPTPAPLTDEEKEFGRGRGPA